MKKWEGIGIGNYIVTGKAFIYERKAASIRRKSISDVPAELNRLNTARDLAEKQLSSLYRNAHYEIGESSAQIFEVHRLLLNDETYIGEIRKMITERKVCAEYAISVTSKKLSKMFSDMEDAFFRARSIDIQDLSDRLIACLDTQNTLNASGGKNTVLLPDDLKNNIILIARDLSPTEIASLDRQRIAGIVTLEGSSSSHTAILASGRNLPAVVGVQDPEILQIPEGNKLILDASAGEFILDPDPETEAAYLKKQKAFKDRNRLLESLRGQKSITLDGTGIKLYANISSLEDAENALQEDAEGIGLFRSEFLYLTRQEEPAEEEQFKLYKKILTLFHGKEVIIRTLDIGADKTAEYLQMEPEANPALGLRGSRFTLERPQLFKTQLRALYRASAFGTLSILFPMISSLSEVLQIRQLCREVREELEREHLPYDPGVKLGIMIETPAGALISDQLAEYADFFSIGTNDLTQYTLACDRQNAHVASYCDPHHEAVLRLIRMTAENARAKHIPVGICGELASDIDLTASFLSWGIDELSVVPSAILPLREKIRNLSLT